MREDLKEAINLSIQKILPFLLSLLFIFCTYIPSGVSVSHVIRPDVGMICVFYWVLHRPDLFNLFTVFFLGFVSDILSSAPLGSDIIAYLTIYLVITNLSSFFVNKSFQAFWYGFGFVLVLVEFLKWLIVSIFYTEFLPLERLLFTILFTIAWYPVVSFFNDAARKYLMNDEG
ncbi:MAG: rod shape-determining protein MreD [Alphaproteobacteria bacterium]|nr:rod shape-determining protein MreD [Alphaproteobacteria bacterium]